MSVGGLSFTPERRFVSSSYYQFSGHMGGYSGKAGFTPQDTLAINLIKAYEATHSDLTPQKRGNLVDLIVKRIPIVHYNITFLITATLIIYNITSNNEPFNPENFDKHFKIHQRVLSRGIIEKNKELKKELGRTREEAEARAKKEELIRRKIEVQVKMTLYRYCIYVNNQLINYSKRIAK